MNLSLKGKTALVTGASSGIGMASAISLAKAGAKVALLVHHKEGAEEVEKELKQLDAEYLVLEADVSDEEKLKTAVTEAGEKWGEFHAVLVNAGINGTLSPIEDLNVEDWDKTIHTNLKSTFMTVKYCIPYMKENGGSIVITSSINGNRIFKNFGMSAYSTSKAGQMAFGKMAALELAQYGIRVNIICPGAIDTNIDENTFPEKEKLKKIEIPVEYPEGNQPLEQKAGEPEQVADLVLFLTSDASKHITGTELFIDGAESLL
ncbi:SDR family oxidoreductase [Bacillus lacus]|uniref:SDR family oxidoreductase n=1 Tax=Metabacillus lacus TaxID=1983721 RepID=A0A7X2J1B9_9BACI|nr:SDR family NAD(P)-dependent oxidoreductase [Metabacillus lacus]MRX73302.1 SDR family oxidoreductase [Metabacillus lacus]